MSWAHEQVPADALTSIRYHEISHIRDLPRLLQTLRGV
jgi:hypothetical protein